MEKRLSYESWILFVVLVTKAAKKKEKLAMPHGKKVLLCLYSLGQYTC
jgi:hypothetical protein